MTTAYTSLLGLALPVTGELSGTWGDTVNNSITSLLDSAIAGTTTLSSDADVTLSNNDGTADTSRQAILLWTAGGTVTRTITAPALSKIYTVINASSSTQSIKVVGAGPTTGVTIVKGESALIAWNGSDFVKVSNSGGSFTTQDLTVTGNTILGDAITDTTTLNAQTRFQSRAILGYANMTGPATTSLTTTAPAFLYSGATTYTVSDVSGGTQAFAPVISLGQATITNATTNTTYTNAATLYIAGAPNAGTNITITNPYALYVAAGNSYLGGALSAISTSFPVIQSTRDAVSATSAVYLAYRAEVATTSPTATTGFGTGIMFSMSLNGVSTELGRISGIRNASDSDGLLRLQGTGAGRAEISSTGLAVTGSIKANQGNFVGVARADASLVSYISNVADNETQWVSAGGGSFSTFYTAGSERMRLDSSGNLGIGNTSPTSYNAAADNLVIGTSGSNGLTIVSGTTNDGSIHFADGTSGADAYRGQIFYSHAANYMVFSTDATERMRIDSSGNVGIGTSSPAVTLSVNGTIGVFGGSLNGSIGSPQLYRPASDTLAIATGAVERMRIDSSGYLTLGATPAINRIWASSGNPLYGLVDNVITVSTSVDTVSHRVGIAFAPANRVGSGIFANNVSTSGGNEDSNIEFYVSKEGNLNATLAGQFDANGNLLVGTTSSVFGSERVAANAGSARVFVGKTTSSGSEVYSAWSSATSGDNRFAGFWTETAANERGSITYNRAGGLVAYNTTSDYRAKDISGPITNSGALIDSVPVYTGTMKGATQERPMFIAHETPNYAHTGEKDAVDADGKPVYQQMDASALIPVMWAEIQSLRKRLAAANL